MVEVMEEGHYRLGEGVNWFKEHSSIAIILTEINNKTDLLFLKRHNIAFIKVNGYWTV